MPCSSRVSAARAACLITFLVGLAAHAQAQTYDLTIHMVGPHTGAVGVVPTGKVCSSDGAPGGLLDCTFAIPADAAIRISANAPNASSPGVFSGGTNAAAGCAKSTCHFTMNADSEVTATFTPATPAFTMSFTLLGDGDADVGSDNNRCQNFDPAQFSACTTRYAQNSVVTITAWDLAESRFSAFSGGTNNAAACDGTVTPCSFELNANSEIAATYYKLTGIGVSPPSATVGIGGSQAFAAVGTFSDASTKALTSGFGTWKTRAPLPRPRYDLAAASHGGMLYAIGGAANTCGPGCFGPSGDVDAYDPMSNTWTTRASLGVPREGLAAVAIGPRIYAVGGNQPGPPPASAVATLEIYDPVSNTWSMGAPMAGGPRQWLGGGAVNGLLYAVGGMDETGAFLGRVEAYDPGTDTWTLKAPMTVPRRFFGVGVVNGILYAVGGDNGSNLATVEAYDPTAGPLGTWTMKAPLPSGRSLHSVAVVDGVLYAIGGNNGAYVSTVFAYDPTTDTWTSRASMPTVRAQHASAVLHGRVYALGGLLAPTFPPQVTSTVETFVDLAWGTSDAGIATVTQNGHAVGQAAGMATVTARVGPVTCLLGAPHTCAEITVTDIVEPPSECAQVTFTLLPGSLPATEVQVMLIDPPTGDTLSIFSAPIGVTQTVRPGRYHLVFSDPEGRRMTSAQRGLNLSCGDDVTVRLRVHQP